MTTDAKAALLALVERVFADGVLESSERADLQKMYRQGGLTVPEVKEVFATFVRKTWGEVIADGVVSPEERTKLETILKELKLPPTLLPEDLRRGLGF